jgi:hypothetical protein
MPRGVYLLGCGLALVALGLALTDWALSLQPGVTEANVRRVQPDMTSGQVEAILGKPTSVMQGERRIPYGRRHEWAANWNGTWFAWQVDNERSVIVLFRNGVVRFVAPDLKPRSPLSPLARLRAWLGW